MTLTPHQAGFAQRAAQGKPTVYARLMEFNNTDAREIIGEEISSATANFAHRITATMTAQLQEAYIAGAADGYAQAVVQLDEDERRQGDDTDAMQQAIDAAASVGLGEREFTIIMAMRGARLRGGPLDALGTYVKEAGGRFAAVHRVSTSLAFEHREALRTLGFRIEDANAIVPARAVGS